MVNVKEKAKELMDKFDYPNIKTGLMSIERKQCAIICVDEMIDVILWESTPNVALKHYYDEVKQEIKKL